MSTLPPSPSRLWTLGHWATVAAGWALYAYVGWSFAQQSPGAPASLGVQYTCFALVASAATLALHRWGVRQRWILLKPMAALLWSLGGVSAVGLLLALWVHVSSPWLFEGPRLPLSYSLVIGANGAFMTGVLTALYGLALALLRGHATRVHNEALAQEARNARLSALEAQMNPHFLFNSLNSLRGMIAENPSIAQDMVTRLANLLRHSLLRDAGQPCRFEEEYEMVQDYLSLESVRFEERLQTAFVIDPQVLTFPVPSLCLQTLVENAVKHGIAPLPQGGLVRLTARVLDAERWQIDLENPGQLGESSQPGTRVGLRNVRERLKLLHGDRATFELTEPQPGLVRARLTLPRPSSS